MDILELREYFLNFKGATEDFPFNEDTLVFKVMGKMFGLVSLEKWELGEPAINVKCDPEKALELREKYPEEIYAGYHMNKKHWNTVIVNGSQLNDQQLKHFITHSYELVVSKLTQKQKQELKEMQS
ncbi:MmcQ/YjbR family DNA-binding protein [Mesonia aestuariivivens]|uniref:MmcQ/YjbR family DNA-binding protein n=1 Tax=Mesonia aestuariivivens TaxID=2796128 RepID=A0ABS6W614_9FLAO|nr:MmcQ/YjbR family DNA-binding protein [Mesonia aestuariivivens]MBW2962563.1 MmcQ/YjbR family DNA-binding protein [Mesonia aestuariivivens]